MNLITIGLYGLTLAIIMLILLIKKSKEILAIRNHIAKRNVVLVEWQKTLFDMYDMLWDDKLRKERELLYIENPEILEEDKIVLEFLDVKSILDYKLEVLNAVIDYKVGKIAQAPTTIDMLANQEPYYVKNRGSKLLQLVN